MEGILARSFRATAARTNYLAQDRGDLMYVAKEVCRNMSRPTIGGWRRFKRIARYLVGKPRLVYKYPWQGRGDEMTGYSDSDWAGCKETGKSTSGGLIMTGSHFIKGWARTQKNIALNSGEAELVAMVNSSCEMIGMT